MHDDPSPQAPREPPCRRSFRSVPTDEHSGGHHLALRGASCTTGAGWAPNPDISARRGAARALPTCVGRAAKRSRIHEYVIRHWCACGVRGMLRRPHQ